jgi:hypothetical protein
MSNGPTPDSSPPLSNMRWQCSHSAHPSEWVVKGNARPCGADSKRRNHPPEMTAELLKALDYHGTNG